MEYPQEWVERREQLDAVTPNDHDFMEPDHIARFLRNHNTGTNNIGRQTLVQVIMAGFRMQSRPISILDIACGTCVNYEVMRQMHPAYLFDYHGYDRTQKLLDHAKQLYGDEITVHRGHAQDLPFDDNVFDVTILRHILEHMSPEDAYAAISEAIRVADKEAFIVFFEPPVDGEQDIVEVRNSNVPDHPEITHYWNRYSKRKLMNYLWSFGYRVRASAPIVTPGAAHADTIFRISKA